MWILRKALVKAENKMYKNEFGWVFSLFSIVLRKKYRGRFSVKAQGRMTRQHSANTWGSFPWRPTSVQNPSLKLAVLSPGPRASQGEPGCGGRAHGRLFLHSEISG